MMEAPSWHNQMVLDGLRSCDTVPAVRVPALILGYTLHWPC